MEAVKSYKSLVEKVKYYIKELDYYGGFQFKAHPVKNEWSMGQIYDYLLNETYLFHLENITKCFSGKDAAQEGKKTFKGKLLFGINSLSSNIEGVNKAVYKPGEDFDPPKKMQDKYFRLIKMLNKTALEIDRDKPAFLVKHPSLGYLSATEWFHLIDLQFRYYIKPKQKLDKNVRSHSKELAED